MANAPSALEPLPGIASGMNVATDVLKASSTTLTEKLGTRHRTVSFDVHSGQFAANRIKQRIERAGQALLAIVFMPDWRLASADSTAPPDDHVLIVSAVQEVLAADGRAGTPRWIQARDLRTRGMGPRAGRRHWRRT
jgi:hypothetical protein